MKPVVQAAIAQTVDEFGKIDVVIANAGILPATGPKSLEMAAWHDAVAVMLTGVFHTLKAAMGPMIEAGNGGSMLITSSTAGQSAIAYNTDLLNPGEMGYTASKAGVIGLMRNFARALGPHKIRVNSVHPMGVRTPMLDNDFFAEVIANAPPGWCANLLGFDLIEPEDVSNTMLWLASDDSLSRGLARVDAATGRLVATIALSAMGRSGWRTTSTTGSGGSRSQPSAAWRPIRVARPRSAEPNEPT